MNKSSRIEAEDFYQLLDAQKQQILSEHSDNHFQVVGLKQGSALFYPSVHGVAAGQVISLVLANGGESQGRVTISANGTTVGTCTVPVTGAWSKYTTLECGTLPAALQGSTSVVNLLLSFSGVRTEFARLDYLTVANN